MRRTTSTSAGQKEEVRQGQTRSCEAVWESQNLPTEGLSSPVITVYTRRSISMRHVHLFFYVKLFGHWGVETKEISSPAILAFYHCNENKNTHTKKIQ